MGSIRTVYARLPLARLTQRRLSDAVGAPSEPKHSVVASREVTTRFGNRVFFIDTGMLGEADAGRASALEIRDGRFTAHRVDRTPRSIPPPSVEMVLRRTLGRR
jgi:hypothetical protein